MDKTNHEIIKRIVGMFLEVEYPWKPVLVRQLQNATFNIEFLDNACFLNYSVPKSCEKIKDIPRVPLTILLDYGCADNTSVLLRGPQMITFSDDCSQSPVGCNIHILDGYLHEIELFTLDGTVLNLEHVLGGKRYYLLNSETR